MIPAFLDPSVCCSTKTQLIIINRQLEEKRYPKLFLLGPVTSFPFLSTSLGKLEPSREAG